MAKAGAIEGGFSGWMTGLGILFLLLGMILMLHPVAATFAMAMLIAIILFVGGLAQFAFAFAARKWTGFLFMLLMSLVYVVAAAYIFFNPVGGVLTLTLVMGALLIVGGCIKIAMSQSFKALENSGWLLFDGIIGMLLGVLVIMAWPSDAAWIMGLFVGINLLFGGITFLLLGTEMKKIAG